MLDPANLCERGSLKDSVDLISDTIDLLADRISVAHVKDRGDDGRVVTPGKGVIDFDGFPRELSRAGFAGPVIAHDFAV